MSILNNTKNEIFIPEDEFQLTIEERKVGIDLIRTMMVEANKLRHKSVVGIEEVILYNYFRGKPLFVGIPKLRVDNYERTLSDYNWSSLTKYGSSKTLHNSLQTELGDKYLHLIKKIPRLIQSSYIF